MEMLTQQQEDIVMQKLAKEFLEDRLGIEATDQAVLLMSNYIKAFEKQWSDLGKM